MVRWIYFTIIAKHTGTEIFEAETNTIILKDNILKDKKKKLLFIFLLYTREDEHVSSLLCEKTS